jgi:site-specific recombinase XerD
MKLSEAVAHYVGRRRSEGSPFISSEITLRSLCKFCGDIELRQLSTDRIAKFLNAAKCSPNTVGTKFSAVKCFVDYYSARNQIASLLIPKPPKNAPPRFPYIYTPSQFHSLLVAALRQNRQEERIDGETLRMMLLVLYATGAMHQEVLSLKRSSLDLRHGSIELEGNSRRMKRTVPIGTELKLELSKFLAHSRCSAQQNDFLFCYRDGEPIKRCNLWNRFFMLHKTAGLAKSTEGHEPRLQDLRFTFAVHRLSLAIRQGEKLSELIPALSAYMGYSSLTKAEQFLAYVPERFSEDLRKLSPTKGREHWRDAPDLLHYLNSL